MGVGKLKPAPPLPFSRVLIDQSMIFQLEKNKLANAGKIAINRVSKPNFFLANLYYNESYADPKTNENDCGIDARKFKN